VCELLGVDKLRTTAYKPSTNGALERMLGKIVDEKQKDWDVHVAYVMTAYVMTRRCTVLLDLQQTDLCLVEK